MSRLDELYAMRNTIEAEIAHEEAALQRMGLLRDGFHEALAGNTAATTQVIIAAAWAFGRATEEITGRATDADSRAARHIVCWLLADQGVSYSAIGRTLGGRDHTTVMASVRRVNSTPRLQTAAYRIRESLRRGSPERKAS